MFALNHMMHPPAWHSLPPLPPLHIEHENALLQQFFSPPHSQECPAHEWTADFGVRAHSSLYDKADSQESVDDYFVDGLFWMTYFNQ